MPESPELLMVELLRLLTHCCICDEPATRMMHSDVLLDTGEAWLFCDEHGSWDVERFKNLTQVDYEDLTQAEVVRRCRLVRVMPPRRHSITECDYHGAVEGFCQVVNERLNKNIKEGSTWVRVKPPSMEELDAIAGGIPRLMPFTRSGSLARVLALYHHEGVRMIDIDIGGDTASYEFEAFNRAFIQAIDGHRWHLEDLH